MARFPKLNTSSEFPHMGNIDVFKYNNDFDYSRYDYTQMELTICAVPWDMGEAHIGNRTISGIGNVVYFESKEKRDNWFASIPDEKCFRFSTKFKELHREHVIDVPLPYDVAATYNYLVVHYEMLANADSLVQFEREDGIRDWFWFIREVEFVAPNTTRLHLLEDAFQTWIYDVNISGMILERGHAPLFGTSVDNYLDNPIANNTDLLTEDVNYGAISNIAHAQTLELNAGTMYACIATSAWPCGNWGTKAAGTWSVPTLSDYTTMGNPSVYVFALAVENLNTFLANVTSAIPQFKQTVQAVFFTDSQLLDIGTSFTFADTTCYTISSSRKTLELVELEKSMFGYDPKYSGIAKLYTYPYAQLEITDEKGNTDVVRIEDTGGIIDVSLALSIAWPFISIDAHLLGIGSNTRQTINYKNITEHTFSIGGRWYDTLRSWDVPTFALVLDPAFENDYATHFDRAQSANDYTTDYNNAIASSDTAKANTATIASTNKSNADTIADTLVANTAIQTTANSTITTRSNSAATSDTQLANALAGFTNAFDNIYIGATTNNNVDAAYASAAIGVAGGIVSGAANGAVSGAPLGPAGAAAGAVTGLVSGAISGAVSMAQTAIAANQTETQASYNQTLNNSKTNSTNSNNVSRTENQNSANNDNIATTNTASTGVSANSAAAQKANASRTQSAENTAAAATNTTEKANATRNADNAAAAIQNSIKQAALRAPSIYGNFANGEGSATKPIALFANVATQSRSAIAAAGDEMLRYGYMYDRFWAFDGNWNIGKHFTYWKLRDFWVSDLDVPDMYMDRLRFFLFGGVTVWRNPEDIGHVSIYDNI